jgi:hypothetical protein
MKIKLLFLLLAYSLSARAQQADSLKTHHKHHRFQREHFLFIGGNVDYLTVKTLNSSYNYSTVTPPHAPNGNYGYSISHETITDLHSGLPGFQVNYISYHKVSSVFSYYNGEGFIFYHNELNYNQYHTYTPFYYDGLSHGEYANESDTTLNYINSEALFIHYILGCRISLPDNFYLNVAVEPHLIIFSNLQPQQYSLTWYDSVGHVTSISDSSGKYSTEISAFNINATLGIGYKFLISKQHSLCIEFNYCPNLFNSDILFDSNELGERINGLGEFTLYRYSFELNVGYKF